MLYYLENKKVTFYSPCSLIRANIIKITTPDHRSNKMKTHKPNCKQLIRTSFAKAKHATKVCPGILLRDEVLQVNIYKLYPRTLLGVCLVLAVPFADGRYPAPHSDNLLRHRHCKSREARLSNNAMRFHKQTAVVSLTVSFKFVERFWDLPLRLRRHICSGVALAGAPSVQRLLCPPHEEPIPGWKDDGLDILGESFSAIKSLWSVYWATPPRAKCVKNEVHEFGHSSGVVQIVAVPVALAFLCNLRRRSPGHHCTTRRA